MKQKILDSIKDFYNLCYTMFNLGAGDFAKNNFSYSDMKGWPLHLKFTVFFARFRNPFVFTFLYYLNQIYRRINHALRH